MDSSRGILVEYKLDAFNMPRTGTTLSHPKIGYVDPSVIPLSTRMEITPTLPKYQTRNSRWHPKFNSYNCNMSFVKNAKKTQSLTSDDTRCHLNLVEKRKISYFVLARYLIRHRISPNQDDISHSARTFISGYQTGERPNTLSSAGGGD